MIQCFGRIRKSGLWGWKRRELDSFFDLRGIQSLFGVGMWMIATLYCMNVTPLHASPASKPVPPTSRPTGKKKLGAPKAFTLKPSRPFPKAAPGKPGTGFGFGKARRKPNVGKVRRRPPVRRRAAVKRVDCKGRMRYGKYCLGRVIGPQFSSQILRCPHCGKDVHVKRLDKPWKPASYDSDLRPYFGHYKQKDRIWICRYCGYASYGADFFKPFNKRKMSESLKPVGKLYPSYNAIPSDYKFLAANAAYVARGKNPKFFGRLFLRAMWSAREEKKDIAIQSFRRAAILAMRLAAKRKLFALQELPAACLQLADILRQEGQWAESRYWLERSYHSLEKANKAKIKARYARFINRWILQIQQRIAGKQKAVFQLDGKQRKR